MPAAGPESLRLLSTTEMYRADAMAIETGVPGVVLMENAGTACADAICARFEPCETVVLCGGGNNGGDGLVIARLLRERGWPVRAALIGEGADYSGDAAVMFGRWAGACEALAPAAIAGAGLIVDAIFGAGLSRAVQGVAAAVIEAANRADVPVVAIDIPSGVDGDTGAVHGMAIRAALTVTFFRAKPGHRLLPGRACCGETVVADIGISGRALEGLAPALFDNAPGLWRTDRPRPDTAGHKYARGHAVVVSGPMASTGAARLGAMAALRAGAGLVSVASPPDAVAVNAAQLTAVMVKPFEGPAGLARLLDDRRFNVVLIGPGAGVGGPTRALTRVALASGAAVLLDADVLTSFEGRADDLAAAIAEVADRPVIVTPHEGEFSRLFKDMKIPDEGKHERARWAAAALGATVVLKGPDTVVAAADGTAAINTNAPATLATAGSGDVLAGIAAGLLAQGMPAFAAACAATWIHGDAASRFGPGLIAEDLADMMPAVFAALDAGTD